MEQHLADILIAFVIAVSASLGLTRGLIRELLSLFAWVIAAVLALQLADPVASWMVGLIDEPRLRWLLALALVFVPMLVLLSVLAALLARLFLRGGLDSHDMLFGLLFGAARGVVVVLIAVLVGRSAGLADEHWWQTSNFIPRLEALVEAAKPYLPPALAKYLEQSERPQATRRLILSPDAQGHYAARGRVNGVPVELLIDTGASLVTVPPALAERLGLTQGKPIQIQTATGEITAYETQLDSVQVGNLELRGVHGAINPQGQGEQVLLGMSFLRRLDFQQNELGLVLEQTELLEQPATHGP